MAIEQRHDDQLLTVREVAERLRLHPITVRRHIASGRLPAVRIGRAVRVREADVRALGRRQGPEPVTAEEIERRRQIVERMLARRAKMKPLGITTTELVRKGREELERRAERHLGLRR
jgi:excisionase family DNA binding protein